MKPRKCQKLERQREGDLVFYSPELWSSYERKSSFKRSAGHNREMNLREKLSI
jgi:hypothetical protein